MDENRRINPSDRDGIGADNENLFAKSLGMHPSITTYEIPGEAVKGDMFMEYYVDDEQVRQTVLKLFYKPVL